MRNPRYRQTLLLAASYLFYASWGVIFLAVLIASSLLNYVWGRLLRRVPTVSCLWAGIALNVLLLGFFKYLAPLASDLSSGAGLGHMLHGIVMPVGISFWTFQALSYLFDVYRQEEAEPSLREFCLYLAFWPTVLSGPVCRLPEMLPQFRNGSPPTWDDLSSGMQRLILGLFMKLVLAELLDAGIRPGQGVS